MKLMHFVLFPIVNYKACTYVYEGKLFCLLGLNVWKRILTVQIYLRKVFLIKL